MEWNYSYNKPPHSEHTTVLQGVTHKQPNTEDLGRIKKLFGQTGETLETVDMVFAPLEPKPLDVAYSVEADDKQVLKLMPNTQFKLWEE